MFQTRDLLEAVKFLAFAKWLNQASSPDKTSGIAVSYVYVYLRNICQALTMYLTIYPNSVREEIKSREIIVCTLEKLGFR